MRQLFAVGSSHGADFLIGGVSNDTSQILHASTATGTTVRAWGWALYTRRLELNELAGYELAYGGEVKR